jgi:hypothetical protein
LDPGDLVLDDHVISEKVPLERWKLTAAAGWGITRGVDLSQISICRASVAARNRERTAAHHPA